MILKRQLFYIMKYNFDKIVDRRKTNSIKWGGKFNNELEMWIADMDFAVLPEIKNAILKKVEKDAYGYCYPTEEYFKSYISWFKSHHNLVIDKDWMIFSTGVVASIDTILKRVAKPGEEVVMFTPIYNVFFNCIRNNGLETLPCSLLYENGKYAIHWSKLEELLQRSTVKVLLLCNPHNPCGVIFSKEDLIRLCELCYKNNVLIISDEIHCDITDPKKEYVPILSCSTEDIIALVSPTKAFNLAGIQTSVIIIPDSVLKDTIERGIGADDNGDPNTFAIEAAIAAYKYGDEWNKQVREYIFKNKTYVKRFLSKEIPGLEVRGGDATYLMWVNIGEYSKDSEEFVHKLQEETGLHLAAGSIYGSEGNTFVRINVATSLENVKDCCRRLKAFLIK